MKVKGLLFFLFHIAFIIKLSAQTTPIFGNPGPITICINGTYYLAPSSTGTWGTSSPTIASVNSSGYVTGLAEGSCIISLSNGGNTVSATINVQPSSSLTITDPSAQKSYKFDDNSHGPFEIGNTINYIGYNGFNYYSNSPPSNTGFYRANKQDGVEGGCPYEYYIFRCTTCDNNDNTITQDGLILSLDAGNPLSYPGSGTIWHDLSIMHNDMTISSALETKYASSFKGLFNFDGLSINTIENNSINGANISSTNAVTFEVWVNQNTVTGYQFWISTIGCCDFRFGIYDAGGLFWNMGDHSDITYADEPLIAGNWYHMLMTSGLDGGALKTKIYINGVLKTTFDEGRNSLPNINSIFIGSGEGFEQYLLDAKLSVIRIYNKTLSATEVSKNYNALKLRFGL